MKLEPRIVTAFPEVEADQWNRLEHRENPFLSHTFLAALESSGALSPELGWSPCHLALYDADGIAAFAPTYLKTNSHGEFVFDWAWADAYGRHGQPYYPKLLTAIPYSPVTGPRLLARQGHPDAAGLRARLVAFALELCQDMALSSWHCNFVTGEDATALEAAGLLARGGWQFHWRNAGYTDFDDFQSRLRSRKRKNSDTFRQYGNHAALNPAFFGRLAEGLGERLVVARADRGGEPVAMSLYLQGGGRLYGRYWGCVDSLPALHFDTAYYQGIEFCIRNGLQVFESGAQGEHKIARGFLPAATRSFHYLRDARFRDAIAHFLDRERSWLEEYREQIAAQDPFRRDLA